MHSVFARIGNQGCNSLHEVLLIIISLKQYNLLPVNVMAIVITHAVNESYYNEWQKINNPETMTCTMDQTIFTSAKGAKIIEKSWTKAGVTGIINSSIILPSADPFEDINLISIIFRGEKNFANFAF